MSCINASTGDHNNIIVGNTKGTVPSAMMNSINNLDPIVKKLIDLIKVDEDTVDGHSVMAVAFCQQGITTFEHLCNFPY